MSFFSNHGVPSPAHLNSFLCALCMIAIAGIPALSFGVEKDATTKLSPDIAIARGDSCWTAQDSWHAFLYYSDAQKQGGADRQVAWRFARVYTAFALTARTPIDEQWNYSKAKEWADRAVQFDPNVEEGHIALAVYFGWRTFMETDNESKLRASRLMYDEVTRALALNAGDDFAWNIRGQWNREVSKLSWVERLVVKIIYGGLPDASFDQSIADLQHAILLRPQRIMHYVELGKTYKAMGRIDDAHTAWRQALMLPHSDGVDEKEKEEARALLEKAD